MWINLTNAAFLVACLTVGVTKTHTCDRVAAIPGFGAAAASGPPMRLRTFALLVGAAYVPALAAISYAPNPVGQILCSVSILTSLAVAWLFARQRLRVARTTKALTAFAPRLSIVYAGKSGLHVGMWSPWLERSGISWCVTVPSDDQFDKVQMHYPDVPIVRGALPPTVRGALYPHGAPANSRYLAARPDVTHVFLGHGDSDKTLSASERVLDYDVIAVAGDAAIDRFTHAGVDVPPKRFRMIGRPQTEGIEAASRPMPGSPTVLYAPTWWHADDATNVSSLPVARELIEHLLARDVTVVFRRHFARIQHPDAEDTIAWIDARLEQDARESGRAHGWGLPPRLATLPEVFNGVDVLLSDVSSVVVDFMASGKPMVVYAAHDDDVEAFRDSHPTARGAYVVTRDLTTMQSAFDAAFGADPLADVRRAGADYFLGGPERRDAAARFLAALNDWAN